ncbi:hypothetical protein TrispH2_001223 [Trichoplax sp. H2]|nr:hypothetical protein TrispH2_001223 [Trichoplax sp. H2]|eukprot:RDD46330.1 hypothetical protein TrispH2_001223 [Trichoplax sp. H2]
MALTQEEIVQVTLSVSSYNSQVHVCPTTATIHFLQSTSASQDVANTSIDGWKLIGRGVPAIVQKQTKSKREIELCFVEIGTGFIIWRDSIEPGLKYQSIQDDFHTYCKTKGEYFGFKFASQEAAASHYREIEQIIADSNSRDAKKRAGFLKNALLRRTKRKDISKSSSLRIRKEQISQPCMFKHVTALDDEFLGKASSEEASDLEIAAVEYGSTECLSELYDKKKTDDWLELSADDKRKRLSKSLTVDSSGIDTLKQSRSFGGNQSPDLEKRI